ncbi:MAG TPA: VOC family protein [Kofleriaceae bacterium]|nr:VOC family protein [Kofleriaceae bacterium]
MTTTIPGKPIWFEHVSPHAKRAQAFYGEVFGWRTQSFPMPGGSYDMIFAGPAQSDMIGGYGMPRGDAAMWATVVSVEDVDLTCEAVTSHGGRVLEGPANIPMAGRWARIADPQGAAISIMKRDNGDPPDRLAPPNTFLWIELHTPDPSAALRFYHDVLGYEHKTLPSPAGDYHVIGRGGKDRGGVTSHLAPGAAPHWLPYVCVDDADATVARAKQHGATIVMGPEDVPMAGRLAVLIDPVGASIAILKPDPAMK